MCLPVKTSLAAPAQVFKELRMETTTLTPIASINAVALNTESDILSADDLRQRAYSELLRQAAKAHGLLAAEDAPATDGVLSEEASSAIEALLEQTLAHFG